MKFMCAKDTDKAKISLIGFPYDGTSSYRPGSRFAPPEIRTASYGLENYDPILDRDLGDVSFCDLDDLETPMGSAENALLAIKNRAKKIRNGTKIIAMGGEHLITLPLFELAYRRYQESLWLIQFDAHADLRDDYLGERLSHAAVIRRCAEVMGGFKRVRQIGVRSGTKEEWQLMRKEKTLFPHAQPSIAQLAKKIGKAPVYLTIDLDVLDTSVLPGTGTPEPGGISFAELESALHGLLGLNIIGADVVELAPLFDHSGVSTIVAAKILRTLIFIMDN